MNNKNVVGLAAVSALGAAIWYYLSKRTEETEEIEPIPEIIGPSFKVSGVAVSLHAGQGQLDGSKMRASFNIDGPGVLVYAGR